MDQFTLTGARVVLPGEIAKVTVAGGQIVGLDLDAPGPQIDARGLILAPAMVDIHGDAFERQRLPRPGVAFPLEAALMETDRQLAANGIATASHALTLSWEPGLRSLDMARAVIEGLRRLAPASRWKTVFSCAGRVSASRP